MSNSTSSSTTLLGSTSTTILSSLSSSSSSSSTSEQQTTSSSVTSIVTPSLSALDNSTTTDTSSSNSTLSSTSSSDDSSARLFHTHDSSTLNSSSITSSSSISSSSLPSLSSSSEESSSFHLHSLPKLSTDSSSSSKTSSLHESSSIISTVFSSSSPSSSAIPESTTSSPTYAEASSSASPTTTQGSTTFVYTQIYCLTDESTTITTALPVSTVLQDPSTFSYSSGSTKTTDLSYFANSIPGFRTSTSSSDDNSGSTKGKIAGSVVGSVAGVSIILFLLWFFVFRKKRFGGNHSEKGSFTHSITSTRRLDDEFGFDDSHNYDYSEKPQPSGPSFLSGVLSKFKKPTTNTTQDHYYHSQIQHHDTPPHDTQDLDGLGSLRSSILRGQQIPNERTPITSTMTTNNTIPTTRPSYYQSSSSPSSSSYPQNNTQLRTIDTVYEETESENSTISRSNHRLSSRNLGNSARYQNAGLTNYMLQNPFDESIGIKKPPPPPPPPKRRANSYNVVDANNRFSVESNGSSLTEDTDSSSTDESLGSIQMGDGGDVGDDQRAGFFKEIV